MDQKKTVAGVLLISIVAFALAAYSAYSVSTKPAMVAGVFVYDMKITGVVRDDVDKSNSTSAGDTFYVLGDVFLQDQIDKMTPVGRYTGLGTFTNGQDVITMAFYDITGAGTIVVNGEETIAVGRETRGVIVGGTGQYAGAHGTYTHVMLTPRTMRYTLTMLP